MYEMGFVFAQGCMFYLQVLEAGPLFCIAYVGAALICIGMVSITITRS